MGELSSEMSLEKSSTTRIVDQLVKKNLVKRLSRGNDRRICCIGLTKRGESLTREITIARLEDLRSVIESLAEEEQEQVARVLEILLRAVKEKSKGGLKHCCSGS